MAASLAMRPAGARDWGAIETLFGPQGACGGCWCMYWRVPSTGRYWETAKGAANRAAFQALVESGAATGVLAFAGDAPIGWCSVGARTDYAYLLRSRTLPPPPSADAWCVTCFFVASGWRRGGVAAALLKGAVDLARAQGASALDGYPSKPAAGAKSADAFVHAGLPSLFERAGFAHVCDVGARAVYRRQFSPARREG